MSFEVWEDDGEFISIDHYTYWDLPDEVEAENIIRRHELFTFLDKLRIIEYSRGYDGIYYTITIRKRRNGESKKI